MNFMFQAKVDSIKKVSELKFLIQLSQQILISGMSFNYLNNLHKCLLASLNNYYGNSLLIVEIFGIS